MHEKKVITMMQKVLGVTMVFYNFLIRYTRIQA